MGAGAVSQPRGESPVTGVRSKDVVVDPERDQDMALRQGRITSTRTVPRHLDGADSFTARQ
jgi:hypothetical protein